MKRGAKDRQEGEEEKGRTNLRTEVPSLVGGTRTETRWGEDCGRRKGGRKGEDTAREKEAAQGATKVAVTLCKASKPNERGQKGKKTRRTALRGDVEGNGRVREEEARMDVGEGEVMPGT